MSNLDGFVKQFLTESYENLDKLDRTLIELEKDPRAPDKLASIFRTVHSIKGTTSFFGFSKLGALAHSGENLLSRLRDGVLVLTSEITTGLLAMVDAVREMLLNIEKTGVEGEEEYTPLIERLTSLYQDSTAASQGADSDAGPPDRAKPPPSVPAGKRKLKNGDPAQRIGELLVETNLVQKVAVAAALAEQNNGDPRRVGEILLAHGAVSSQDIADALTMQGASQPSAFASNIRIDVEQLDKLMDLVGELVLARNQILQFSLVQQDSGFLSATQRLNLITTGLQEGIMKARLQPIDNIWSKFPRVVRDLATHFGKRVRLEMEGSQTELDRTIIEAIRDPLTHLVRNCVDHGIEAPEKRVAVGKSPEGRLFLRAFHEGGQVNIEISDDGAGIDPNHLKRKAVELGLVTSEQVGRMDERATMNLIFLPGFSTAEKVTDVSGRGVGMDVVKTNIEKIGGMVDVESKSGEGTTLKIRIPLTLAIIPALIVTSGGQRYAIPQTSVLELVRVAAEKANRGIEMIHGSPVYRLRENLLPLVYLNHELGIRTSGCGEMGTQGQDKASANIVVLRADDRKFGLVVDDVNDTGEIVVKPLAKGLKGISTFAGATIMGDGRVALILDVVGLARSARVLSQASNAQQLKAPSPARQAAGDRQSLLLFTTSPEDLMAIPLSLVTRLEEFPFALLESTGGQQVVQYQGEILPLIDLYSLLPGKDAGSPVNPKSKKESSGTTQVVVYSKNERRVGLKVERILDIVEERLSIQHPPNRKGSLGSAVIQGRVVEILDLDEILNMETFARMPGGWAHVGGKNEAKELVI